MRMHGYLGGRGSTVNRSIAQIAGAVKLTEIVIYDHSAVQYSWIRSIYHYDMQISCSFWLNLLGTQCTHEFGSVAIIIVPALCNAFDARSGTTGSAWTLITYQQIVNQPSAMFTCIICFSLVPRPFFSFWGKGEKRVVYTQFVHASKEKRAWGRG